MVKFWAYFDHIHFIKVYKNVCLNTKNLGKQDTFYLYCWHENTSYPKPGLFNDTIGVGMQCSRGHTTGQTELSFLTLITKRRSAKYPCRLGNVFHSPQELQNVQKFCPDISDIMAPRQHVDHMTTSRIRSKKLADSSLYFCLSTLTFT